MIDLIKEVQEAQSFVTQTKKEIQKFFKFENEEFERIDAGVLSLTTKDSQGDAPSLSNLEEMKKHINNGILFINNNHDPEIQPIGRALHSEIFYSEELKAHFIVGLIGLYNTSSFKSFKTLGINLNEFESDDNYILDFAGLPYFQAQFGFDPHEIPKNVVDEIMLNRPVCVSGKVMPIFMKGDIEKSFIEIFLTTWLACTNPYSKTVLEEFGKRTVAAVCDFLSFLKTKSFDAIQKLTTEDKLQIFKFHTGTTRYSFILNTNDLNNQREAIDSLSNASNAAMKLVSKIPDSEVSECVYKFDNSLNKWMPFYVISGKYGVIIDSPTLISLDSLPTGISIAGAGVLGDMNNEIQN